MGSLNKKIVDNMSHVNAEIPLKSFADLSEAEELQCYVSDTYKDVYGVRPCHYTSEQWNSVEFLQSELDQLIRESKEQHWT